MSVTESHILDTDARKSTLRAFTYGLYAVGVAQGDQRNFFTANWLTQVSFDPPLVAVSVENDSYSIGLIRASNLFSVSVFSSDQRSEAGALGKRWKLRPSKIDDVEYLVGSTGCPFLARSLGAVECRVISSVVAGDSTVFIGEVVTAHPGQDGTPLTMQAAGFKHAG